MKDNPETDFEIHCHIAGRLIAVQFRSTTDVHWSLESYDLDLDVVSRY